MQSAPDEQSAFDVHDVQSAPAPSFELAPPSCAGGAGGGVDASLTAGGAVVLGGGSGYRKHWSQHWSQQVG